MSSWAERARLRAEAAARAAAAPMPKVAAFGSRVMVTGLNGAEHYNGKFGIVKEIMEKYIHNDDIKVPSTRVWLMPCCGSRQEHIEKAAEVAALCKKYNLNFSPRLQLIIWDKALKV
jgi:hypothetical protein